MRRQELRRQQLRKMRKCLSFRHNLFLIRLHSLLGIISTSCLIVSNDMNRLLENIGIRIDHSILIHPSFNCSKMIDVNSIVTPSSLLNLIVYLPGQPFMMKTLIVTPEVRLHCVIFKILSKYLSMASVSGPELITACFELGADGYIATGA